MDQLQGSNTQVMPCPSGAQQNSAKPRMLIVGSQDEAELLTVDVVSHAADEFHLRGVRVDHEGPDVAHARCERTSHRDFVNRGDHGVIFAVAESAFVGINGKADIIPLRRIPEGFVGIIRRENVTLARRGADAQGVASDVGFVVLEATESCRDELVVHCPSNFRLISFMTIPEDVACWAIHDNPMIGYRCVLGGTIFMPFLERVTLARTLHDAVRRWPNDVKRSGRSEVEEDGSVRGKHKRTRRDNMQSGHDARVARGQKNQENVIIDFYNM